MKLAIFDVDGTLTRTNSVDDECFVQALADVYAVRGINTNWAEYPHATDSGITLHIFQERFGRAPAADELKRLKERFVDLLNERYHSHPVLFAEVPGAALALGRLKRESQWAIGVATGCWRASALLKLKVAGIEIKGVPAAFAENELSREGILQSAVSQALNLYRLSSFERIVSIGDGLWDVRAAVHLGLAFLGVGDKEGEARLRRAGATQVIEDFVDYDNLLRALDTAQIPRATGL
jgi:phosphoglycolate phosphatase-like HAD superfamily hydrolase